MGNIQYQAPANNMLRMFIQKLLLLQLLSTEQKYSILP